MPWKVCDTLNKVILFFIFVNDAAHSSWTSGKGQSFHNSTEKKKFYYVLSSIFYDNFLLKRNYSSYFLLEEIEKKIIYVNLIMHNCHVNYYLIIFIKNIVCWPFQNPTHCSSDAQSLQMSTLPKNTIDKVFLFCLLQNRKSSPFSGHSNFIFVTKKNVV